MPKTYTPIATQTLTTSAASVTFSSISGAYTDLVIVANASAGAAVNLRMQFNSDTGANYSNTRIYGDGASAGSDRQSSQVSMGIGIINTTLTSHIINFQNYSNSTTYKTAIARTGSSGYTDSYVGLWRSTAAINSILINASGQNFSIGSTFTLYGILKA